MWRTLIRYRVALFLLFLFFAFLLMGVSLSIGGYPPFEASIEMLRRGFFERGSLETTIVNAVPIILTAFAFSLPFKGNYWNLGGEGQLYIGGILAGWIGFALTGLPNFVHLPLLLCVGFIGGALWGLLPVILRFRVGISEILSSMILNFIGIYIAYILLFGPLGTKSGMPFTEVIASTAMLPRLLGRIHAGFLLVFPIGFILYFTVKKTTFGYKLRCIGLNSRTAEAGGIRVSRVIIKSVLVGAGLAGLAGAVEVSGVYTYMWNLISPNLSYLGIVVAFLSRQNFLGILVGGVFIGGLLTGGRLTRAATGVPEEAAYFLIGLILLMVLIMYSIETKAKVETGG